MVSEGKQREADYFLDCGVYEYYSRICASKRYSDKIKEAMKKPGESE